MVSLYVRYMSEKSKEEEKIATESQRHRERRKAEKREIRLTTTVNEKWGAIVDL